MNSKTYFFVVALIVVIGAIQYSSRPIISPVHSQEEHPIIAIAKKPNVTYVNVGVWFEVSIIVINVSNETAYNIRIEDVDYPSWAVETKNYLKTYEIAELPVNSSVEIKYLVKINKASVSEFSLGTVKATYEDSNGNTYTVVSSESKITVEAVGFTIELSEILNLFAMAIVIFVVPMVAGLIIIERRVYLEYQKRR